MKKTFSAVIITLIFVSFCFANIKFWDGDNIESKGLNGVRDSVGYRVNEIERHLHNSEYWYGAGSDGLVSQNSLTSFTLTAGAINVYGNAVTLNNGTKFILDFPTMSYYDIHRLFVTDVNQAGSTYMVQFWYGTGLRFSTSTATLLTTVPFSAANATQGDQLPLEIISRRIPNGNKLWARVKCQTAGKTISLLLGIHVYTGN